MNVDRPHPHRWARTLVAIVALSTTGLPTAGAADPPDATSDAGLRRVVPSGNLVSEARQTGAFHRIVVDGPMNVEVRQGPRTAVTLRADDNVLPLIESVVTGADGTLHVRYRDRVSIQPAPTVTAIVETDRVDAIALGGVGDIVGRGLKTPRLDVTLGGVGRIDLSGLQADDVKMTVGGSGSIRADGRVRTLALTIAGSGRSDTTALAADDVAVTIAGSGEATLRANRTLDAKVAGSGNVTYLGEPAVKSTILGSGRIGKG